MGSRPPAEREFSPIAANRRFASSPSGPGAALHQRRARALADPLAALRTIPADPAYADGGRWIQLADLWDHGVMLYEPRERAKVADAILARPAPLNG